MASAKQLGAPSAGHAVTPGREEVDGGLGDPAGPGGLPPPYEAACSMPVFMAAGATTTAPYRGDLNHPALYQEAPQRGMLASKGSVPWRWRTFWCYGCPASSSTSVTIIVPPTLAMAPPGPPDAIIEARRFQCSLCNISSFVKQEDVGVYIRCPYCSEVSTTNPSNTRNWGFFFLFLGLLTPCILIALMVWAASVASSRGERRHFIIAGPMFLVMVMLRRSCAYFNVPRSTMYDGFVRYQLSMDEFIALSQTRASAVV